MTANQNNRRLKNYLIKKDIQLRIVITNLLYMFFITLITIAIILYPLISTMYQSPNAEMQYQASQFFLLISERLLLALSIALIFFSIHQIFVTHKFCGPITNFSNTFKKIVEGDLTRKVHLRNSDFLKEEAQCINEMIDVLSNTLTNIKEDHNKLINNLDKVVLDTTNVEEKNESEKTLERALKQAHHINDQLSSFKINNE